MTTPQTRPQARPQTRPPLSRDAIIAEAHRWIDTPYRHQASQFQAGCDCLGLIRGIWRTFYGAEPIKAPPYTPDWAEQTGAETLLNAAQACLVGLENRCARPGDVLLFRMHPNAPVKHMAIFSAPERIIHAYWGRAVVESHFVPFWTRRWSHSFAFPGLADTQSEPLAPHTPTDKGLST